MIYAISKGVSQDGCKLIAKSIDAAPELVDQRKLTGRQIELQYVSAD